MNLDHVFGALADPTRRAILARLALGEVTVGELAEPFDMSLPAVSKHLRVLEQAGLIRKDRVAQSRPCRIEPEALKAVDAWMEDYRKLWGESLDRLEDYLQTLQAKARAKEKKNVRRKK
jgi:DNA-binding transcriptional ArsR family regulator